MIARAPTSLWHHLGRQLARPAGFQGVLTGLLMRVVNRVPIRLAVGALELKHTDSVLELGCGSGEAIALMMRQAAQGKIIGLDTSALMIRQATRRNAAAIRTGRVRLRRIDFHALSYAAATFDKIVAINSAYFWRDPVKLLARIRQLLRPGGRLVIYVTDAVSMRRWKFAAAETHRHYDAAALLGLLIDSGFPRSGIRIQSHELPNGIQGIVAVADRLPSNDPIARRSATFEAVVSR